MVLRAWIDDWNDILRNVIFKDETLKSLMKLPANTDILTFVDKYFIRAAYTTEVLTNESVRIVYGRIPRGYADNPMVTINELSFDIYVKNEDLHNVERDRLVFRTDLIAKRLIDLLTSHTHLGAYHFYVVGEGEMGTSTIGYTRYNVTFSYKKTY